MVITYPTTSFSQLINPSPPRPGFHGTYEEVLEHERKLGLIQEERKFSIYEAKDGFRGSCVIDDDEFDLI